MVDFKKLLGFSPKSFCSWKELVILLNQPRDASILAYTRIVYGILMMIDIPRERGMLHAYHRYGDDSSDFCRFPLINSLEPLGADHMTLLYGILFLSAAGICLGLFYRLSCLSFATIYWYFFLLDKSTWNNHSYLYGLLSILFLLSDAHRYMSLDGLLNKKLKNSHVPLWNYTLLRFQIFLVYFYAGLKKTNADWITGYSMNRLSSHWVFDPLRLVMSDSTMDYFVVHLGGFSLDLFVGFIFFFDKTRWLGYMMCGSFHLMNSQLFRIGMFPYAMLGTMFVFCHSDQFKRFLRNIPFLCLLFDTSDPQPNPSCIYNKTKGAKQPAIRWRHTLVTLLTLTYISEQLCLPYSHSITKGYNGWTQGCYGYSWDMMVHSFVNQHIKISFRDKRGEEGFLKPGAFLSSSKNRWSLHPDMAVQYARCLKRNLLSLGVDRPTVHFDVWKSLNGRFQQRVIDPRVDLSTYEWSPFSVPGFVLPVLAELTPWRAKLKSLKHELRNNKQGLRNDEKELRNDEKGLRNDEDGLRNDEDGLRNDEDGLRNDEDGLRNDEDGLPNHLLDVVFVADFPGMSLENFVQVDFGETSLEVLQGKVEVELESRASNFTLGVGEKLQLPAGQFHTIYTVSDTPSCYFYTYTNTTANTLQEKVDQLRKRLNDTKDGGDSPGADDKVGKVPDSTNDEVMSTYLRQEEQRAAKREWEQKSLLEKFKFFLVKEVGVFRHSFLLVTYGARNVIFGRPDASQIDDEMRYITSWHVTTMTKHPGPPTNDDVMQSKTEL